MNLKKILSGAGVVLLSAALLCQWAAASDGGRKIKVRKVIINTENITVRVNQTKTLFVEIEPFNADDKTVYWSTSNPEIVTVDGDGVITGISPGTADVTATPEDGRAGVCHVTVPRYVLKSIEPDTDNQSNPASEIRGGDVLSAATLRADVETAVKGGKTATVTYRDKTTVSTAALRSAAYTAEYNDGKVSVKIITSAEGAGDGTAPFFSTEKTTDAQGWLTLDPAQAGDEDREIGTQVIADPEKNASLQKQAAQLFGANCAVVQLSHQGDFGMQVAVAAKVDLSGTDTGAQKLYAYNRDTGAYFLLENQSCTVDTEGYLYFSTDQGGSIVITDKLL